MADFCKQCATEHGFENPGHDYIHSGRDLPENKLEPGYGWLEICEGCGFIRVNEQGECIATKEEGCLYGHGDGTKPIYPPK